MRINIPNNKRHIVVAEELQDRCVVTCAATATWRNVDVNVQLFAIGRRNQNASLLADKDRLTVEERPYCRRMGSCL